MAVIRISKASRVEDCFRTLDALRRGWNRNNLGGIWKLGLIACISGTMLSIFTISVYASCWLPYLNSRFNLDLRACYYWEGKAREVLGESLPEHIDPRVCLDDKSSVGPLDPSPPQLGTTQLDSDANKSFCTNFESLNLHVSQRTQLFVTGVFCTIFALALWSKSFG